MEKIILNGQTEQPFLALLSTALHGGSAELPNDVDWQEVFKLASQQRVLPLIVEAVWQSEALTEDCLASLRRMTLQIVITQARRTAAFLALYRSLAEKGLHPLVLKGLVCRELYPEPDKRPSGDEDILIDPSDFQAIHKEFLNLGLHCESSEPSPDLQEITYSNPELRIELHMSPFPTDSAVCNEMNAIIRDMVAQPVTIEVDGVLIYTLDPTTHLMYLLCHACKHFLHSGVGIRQVCDIAFFAEHYADEIDWNRIRIKCEEAHIARFSAGIFKIASRHLGFSATTAFDNSDVDEYPLLRDMLSGGIYGGANENRQHSATITLDAVAKQRQGKKSTGFLASVFIPLDGMASKFPYLKKYPWLLPAAWVQRVAKYFANRGKNTDPAASIRIGRERVALLRKYGIMD